MPHTAHTMPTVRPRRRFPYRFRAALAVVIVLCVVLGVDGAIRVRAARRDLLRAHAELQSAQQTLGPAIRLDADHWPSPAAFADARVRLAAARGEIGAARASLGPILRLAPAARWVPWYGAAITHAPALLALGDEAAAAAADALTAVAPLFDGTDHPALVTAHEVFITHAADVDRALTRLEVARTRADALQRVRWRGPLAVANDTLRLLAAQLAPVDTAHALTRSLASSLDTLIGWQQPARYAVLGENDHEIRATGGFIGTLGVVTLQQGRITDKQYRSSADFDPPGQRTGRIPPEPMVTYMGAGEWLVRDANWWPDYPTSAEQLLQFLHTDARVDAEGAIALDTTMLGLLLRVLGPMQISAYPEPLTPENWLVQAEASILAAERQSSHDVAKQAYLRPVMEELLRRAESAHADQVPGLVRAMRAGVDGRHFQAYHRDPAGERVLAQLGAAGRLQPPPSGSDLVAIVDTNMSYSKIQPAITRDAIYLLRTDGLVDLAVHWRNDLAAYEGARFTRLGATGELFNRETRAFDPAPGAYGNYARIYLPPDARLVEATGFSEAPRLSSELGLTLVSGWVLLRNGEERTVRVTYRPPPGTERVTFWRQGGQTATELRVLRNVGTQQHALFAGTLTADRTVDLR